MNEKEVAIKAAKEAGKLLVEKFGDIHHIKDKGLKEDVTNVDMEAEKIILSEIKKHFPDHNILSEESGEENKSSEYTWIIDPIDGTTNYSVRNPFFNTSIGLAKNNEIILGVIYAPIINELFVAEKGKGAFLNDKKISVSDEQSLSKCLITFCHGKTDEDLKKISEIFGKLKKAAKDFDRMKSGALELAFVAAGRFGGFIYNNVRPWDVAAGILLVKESGGKVTDFEGNEWDLTKKNLVATNGKIHEELLKNIK
ncbi:MAG: inositol monophosphatase family protein [Candidatus Aenigmatarchaeota archaeon]